jgi:hypothetical protein
MQRMNTLHRFLGRLATGAALLGPPGAFGATAAVTLGCGHMGPSNVAQGIQYVPGESNYDPYFATLYSAQLTMGQAPDKEARLRQTLAAAVGTTQVETEPLLLAVGEKTKQMQEADLGISLTVSEPGETPNAELQVTSGLPEAEEVQIHEAIRGAAQGSLEILVEVAEVRATIAKLKAEGPALEPGIDPTFRKQGPVKKSEVRKNLEDSMRLIPLMEKRAGELEESAQKLIEGLLKVGNTAPPPRPPPAASEADGAEPGAAASPPPPSGRRPKPAPAPAPQPKKSSTSDGFEP